MKFLKKLVSCLLVCVISVTSAACLTVSAAAEDENYQVYGQYDNSNKYYLVFVDNISPAVLWTGSASGAAYKFGVEVEFTGAKTKLSAAVSNDGKGNSSITQELTVNGKKKDAGILSNTITVYSRANSVAAYGVRFALPVDSCKSIISDIVKQKKASVTVWVGDKQYYVTPSGSGSEKKTSYDVNTAWNTDKMSDSLKFSLKSDLTYKAIPDQEYTGGNIAPKIVLKRGSYELVEGKDYTASYKNNKNIGKATATIKGKGKFSGTINMSFNIVPSTPEASAVSLSKGKKIMAFVGKGDYDGWELWESKNGAAAKLVSDFSQDPTKTFVIISPGEKGEYKYWLRTYKIVNNEKIYSAFSGTMTLTVS